MSAYLDARRQTPAGVSVDVRRAPRAEPTAVRAVLSGPRLLGEALEELRAGPLHVCLRHGAVEVTATDRQSATWETVVGEAAVSGLGTGAPRRTVVDGDALRSALDRDDEVELRLTANEALVLGDVVLPPSLEVFPEPPRPGTSGIPPQRLNLPPSGGCELILRLDGPTVCVPTSVRQRFSDRQVSSVSLFARDDDWFISGVRNGSPAVVVVGAVGVY
ncbi:MAG: hypothetical protein KY457_06425 [Actinobacteria bacterium]|nr:hypothetical protein [Actinomycetota bacterium]